MAGLVLISSSVFQLNFSAKLKVSSSKSATTQSRETLCLSLENRNLENMNDKEKILYKFLDIIIIESEIAVENNSMNILNGKYLDATTEQEEFFRITDGVVVLGCKLGFLKFISKEPDWFELTEKGILAKEKGGYFKYLDFIKKRELKKIKPTIIAENYIGGDNHGNQSSNNSITNNSIANPNNDQKANSIMLKFWKLISENKLISSLLLVLILWAIKEIFGINLKN